MWYKKVGTSLFRFVTNHAFDRRTDRQTYTLLVASRAGILCNALKIGQCRFDR